MIVFAGLTYYPISKGIRLGQIQVWINALFALALLAVTANRKSVAGALIGTMSLIKPQYVTFLVWGMLRRYWRFALACLVVVAVGAIAAIASWGLAHNLDYLNMLAFLSRHGESYYANQSVNGLLNRIVGISDPLAYPNTTHAAFPPYTPLVYFGMLLSSAVIMEVALLRRTGDRAIDFCIMAVSTTIALADCLGAPLRRAVSRYLR